jgi:hypothetical protein
VVEQIDSVIGCFREPLKVSSRHISPGLIQRYSQAKLEFLAAKGDSSTVVVIQQLMKKARFTEEQIAGI